MTQIISYNLDGADSIARGDGSFSILIDPVPVQTGLAVRRDLNTVACIGSDVIVFQDWSTPATNY